jgi:hypothetical protein
MRLDSDFLSYSHVAVSDNIVYTGRLQAMDLNTGKLIWTGKNGGKSLYIYKKRLYLISNGKLYAYEQGVEKLKAMYFTIFVIPLIIANLFLRIKKYSGKLHNGFTFSSFLTLIAYSLFLVSGIPSFIYNLKNMIPSIDTDWIFYLLFPSLGVIAGTLTGMRTNSKFLIGAATGTTPYLIALIASILLLPDLHKNIFIILFIWPFIIISLEIILVMGLIFGIVGSLFSLIISKMKRKISTDVCNLDL